MQVFIKVALSVAIILVATAIGKKLQATAGLVGVMPLTGALVLVWMYLESDGDAGIMQQSCPASCSLSWSQSALRKDFPFQSFWFQILALGSVRHWFTSGF